MSSMSIVKDLDLLQYVKRFASGLYCSTGIAATGKMSQTSGEGIEDISNSAIRGVTHLGEVMGIRNIDKVENCRNGKITNTYNDEKILDDWFPYNVGRNVR